MKQMIFSRFTAILAILLMVVLAACGQPNTVEVEVTRVVTETVVETVEVEVTRVVTETVVETVEVEVTRVVTETETETEGGLDVDGNIEGLLAAMKVSLAEIYDAEPSNFNAATAYCAVGKQSTSWIAPFSQLEEMEFVYYDEASLWMLIHGEWKTEDGSATETGSAWVHGPFVAGNSGEHWFKDAYQYEGTYNTEYVSSLTGCGDIRRDVTSGLIPEWTYSESNPTVTAAQSDPFWVDEAQGTWAITVLFPQETEGCQVDFEIAGTEGPRQVENGFEVSFDTFAEWQDGIVGWIHLQCGAQSYNVNLGGLTNQYYFAQPAATQP